MKIFVVAICGLFTLSISNAAPTNLDDGPQCKAPNGGGLQAVLDEFEKLIPIDKLLKIYIQAVSSDPEVQEAVEYLESDDFKNIIKAIQEAPEFNGLMAFACDKLYFDAYYYYNLFADMFNLPPLTRPPFVVFKERANVLRRSGLKGMLLDMYDVLPIDEIKKMFEDKLTNDEYVKRAMDLLASDEFKKMVNLVESLDEFNSLLDKIRGMDIDIDAVIKIIKDFFKWN